MSKFHVEMDIATDDDDGPDDVQVVETDVRDLVHGEFIDPMSDVAPGYTIDVLSITVTES